MGFGCRQQWKGEGKCDLRRMLCFKIRSGRTTSRITSSCEDMWSRYAFPLHPNPFSSHSDWKQLSQHTSWDHPHPGWLLWWVYYLDFALSLKCSQRPLRLSTCLKCTTSQSHLGLQLTALELHQPPCYLYLKYRLLSRMTQLVEHGTFNARVVGTIPTRDQYEQIYKCMHCTY